MHFLKKITLDAKVLSAKKRNVLAVEGKLKMSSLKDTVEKIKSLEDEKKNLLVEIDELKKMADTRATALESEVSALREEIKSLRIMMNVPPGPSADRKPKK